MRETNKIGQKFGRLTVKELHHTVTRYYPSGSVRGHRYYYLCECECGNTTIVEISHLKSGGTLSCGCLRDEKIQKVNQTHKLTKTKLYSVWGSMVQRCYNPKDKAYKNYGERGILICDNWRNDFKSFYDWALQNGYKEGLSIDRIDVNGNYEPNNCRWTDAKVQARNTRKNRFITFNNETYCMSEWAEKVGVHPDKLRYWVNKKLNFDEILEQKRRA